MNMGDGRSQPPRQPLKRRTFVQGLALSSAGLAGLPFNSVSAQSGAAAPTVLRGTEFDLRIGATEVNITGRRRMATTVNGTIPAPVLYWKEGTTVTLRVTNTLPVTSSIHWHGILLPAEMDGVPGLSFNGIAPGETFVYRFPVKQYGTYWYHSHSGFQEQTGLHGGLVIEPAAGESVRADVDLVLMLSDWTDEDPERVLHNLKASSDYYNYQMPTVGDFFRDVSTMGFPAAWERRKEWNRMRMNPTDFADISGATYTYLANGQPPAANHTLPFRAGQRVRLRVINSAASSIFDLRIPGLKLTVVSADGQHVEPVTVDELRISTAETYDLVVTPEQDRAYTVFAQTIDRTGFVRATLAPRPGMTAPVPPLDAKTWLTMDDMGMGDMQGMEHGSIPGMQGMSPPAGAAPAPASSGGTQGMQHGSMPGMQGLPPTPATAPRSGMQGMDHGSVPGMQGGSAAQAPAGKSAGPSMQQGGMQGMQGDGGMQMDTSPAIDNRAMSPGPVVTDPGPRLRNNGRRVLVYSDLRTIGGPIDSRQPSRDIVLRLTGNMRRFIWGFDGKKYSEAEPIRLSFGERVRFVLVNDTMMSHPIHLHGMWSEVEDVDGRFLVRKHTVNVHPGKYINYQVTADARGQWALHCHHLYHMEVGMFRKVIVE
jgi:CopA family copper-resistance protein